MIIKTKKYSLPKNKYIKIAFSNTIKDQWWVLLLLCSVSLSYLYFKSVWILVVSLIACIIYIGFWLLQFYGVTLMEQSKMLFQKVCYEISSQKIIIQFNTKQGMPLEWSQIKKVILEKKAIIFIISRAHIIYLPHKIFINSNSIKFLKAILKRKKLLK